MTSIRNLFTAAALAVTAVTFTPAPVAAGPTLSGPASEAWERASARQSKAFRRGQAIRPGVRRAPVPGGGYAPRVSAEARELRRIAEALESLERGERRRSALRSLGGGTRRR